MSKTAFPGAISEPPITTGAEHLLTHPLTIYLPAYNCEQTIVGVISSISKPILESANILVIDNCSEDSTIERLQKAKEKGLIPQKVIVLKTPKNLGYAGSQKFAYEIFRRSDSQWIVMLHGDGQYPPELLDRCVPLLNPNLDLVYGYRSKTTFSGEETPFLTWFLIKSLSLLESLVTGVYRKEWHTGFVMYRNQYLKKINFEALTTTPHFDGHMLFVSNLLGAKVKAVPIYKKYKELTAFEGKARRKYVLDVLRLMFQFRRTTSKDVLLATSK